MASNTERSFNTYDGLQYNKQNANNAGTDLCLHRYRTFGPIVQRLEAEQGKNVV